jgi:hypothetical protein
MTASWSVAYCSRRWLIKKQSCERRRRRDRPSTPCSSLLKVRSRFGGPLTLWRLRHHDALLARSLPRDVRPPSRDFAAEST